MDTGTSILDVFSKFNLDRIPKAWIKTLWDSNFDDIAGLHLPLDYESEMNEISFSDLLECTCKFVKDWVLRSDVADLNTTDVADLNTTLDRSFTNSYSADISAKSWKYLIDNGVQHKALVSLLSFFIHQGISESTDLKIKFLGLKATHLYLLLLTVPDSIVFQIFNPILYSYAIELLKKCAIINYDCVDKSKDKMASRDRPKLKGQKKVISQESFSDEEQSSDEGACRQKQELLTSLNSLLTDLTFVFICFSLKSHKDSLILSVQVLLLIARSNLTANTISKAYEALLTLCTNNNNDMDTMRLIMNEMLPVILSPCGSSNILTVQEIDVIRDRCVQFIKQLFFLIKDSSSEPVETFIQHLCVRTPDKAEIRSKIVQIIIDIMRPLQNESIQKLLICFMKLTFNDNIKCRNIALDLIGKLVLMKENGSRQIRQVTAPEDDKIHTFLLSVIFYKCGDRSSVVRSKALTILGNIILSNSLCEKDIKNIFILQNDENGNKFSKLREYLLRNELTGDFNPLPNAKFIITLLEASAMNNKVFVRKAAFQVLTNIFLISERWMTERLLKVMVKSCCDNSVLIRKLLIHNLSDLMIKYPTNSNLAKHWVLGILPLVGDEDNKVQEKVIEAIHNIIICNMIPYSKLSSELHQLPWLILKNIIEEKMQKNFAISCREFAVLNNITMDLIECVRSYIGTKYNYLAWYLLCCFSDHIHIDNPNFIKDYFCDNIHNDLQVDEYCLQVVTSTLFKNVSALSVNDREYLLNILQKSITEFAVPLPVIAKYIDMCYLLTDAIKVKEWASNIMEIAQGKLERRIGPNAPTEIDDEKLLCQVIFTIGEVSQICCCSVNDYSVNLIQNVLVENDPTNTGARWQGKVNLIVKRVCVITLGKICLLDEQSASALVPLFGYLLSNTEDKGIKINSMIAITDLCIRYTSLVERYIPDMSLSLGDNDIEVKQCALSLIMNLIQEDYLKLRCPLFFHLLLSLNDCNQDIRNKMVTFMIHTVLKKNKNFMIQNFIESFYHYNQYESHPTFSKCVMTDEEKAVFSLKGPKSANERRAIYKFMLKHMEDDHRFQVMYKICVNILEQVVEEKVILTPNGQCLLQDALYILGSEDIRMSYLRKTNKGDEENEDKGLDLNHFAKKTLLLEVMRKNIIENIVPVILRLKAKLYQMKSRLHKDLMVCLCNLMKDFKKEINEIFADDTDTAAEVAYDLKHCGDDSADESDTENVYEKEVMKEVLIQSILSCDELKGTAVEAVATSTINRSSVKSGVRTSSHPAVITPGQSPPDVMDRSISEKQKKSRNSSPKPSTSKKST